MSTLDLSLTSLVLWSTQLMMVRCRIECISTCPVHSHHPWSCCFHLWHHHSIPKLLTPTHLQTNRNPINPKTCQNLSIWFSSHNFTMSVIKGGNKIRVKIYLESKAEKQISYRHLVESRTQIKQQIDFGVCQPFIRNTAMSHLKREKKSN